MRDRAFPFFFLLGERLNIKEKYSKTTSTCELKKRRVWSLQNINCTLEVENKNVKKKKKRERVRKISQHCNFWENGTHRLSLHPFTPTKEVCDYQKGLISKRHTSFNFFSKHFCVSCHQVFPQASVWVSPNLCITHLPLLSSIHTDTL